LAHNNENEDYLNNYEDHDHGIHDIGMIEIDPFREHMGEG